MSDPPESYNILHLLRRVRFYRVLTQLHPSLSDKPEGKTCLLHNVFIVAMMAPKDVQLMKWLQSFLVYMEHYS